MLYKIFETQRTLMEPFADFALATAKLYSNPMSPLGNTSLGQRVSAGYDLIYRLGKDYVKPEFGIRSIEVDGVEIAIHERVEMNTPFCELRRFKRFTDNTKTLAKMKSQNLIQKSHKKAPRVKHFLPSMARINFLVFHAARSQR